MVDFRVDACVRSGSGEGRRFGIVIAGLMNMLILPFPRLNILIYIAAVVKLLTHASPLLRHRHLQLRVGDMPGVRRLLKWYLRHETLSRAWNNVE